MFKNFFVICFAILLSNKSVHPLHMQTFIKFIIIYLYIFHDISSGKIFVLISTVFFSTCDILLYKDTLPALPFYHFTSQTSTTTTTTMSTARARARGSEERNARFSGRLPAGLRFASRRAERSSHARRAWASGSSVVRRQSSGLQRANL